MPARSDEEAVRRELAEETGLAVDAGSRCGNCLLPGSPGHHPAFRLLVFRGYRPERRACGPATTPTQVGWFRLDEMERLPIIPSVLETRAIDRGRAAGAAERHSS